MTAATHTPDGGFALTRSEDALRLVGPNDAVGVCLDVAEVRRRLRQGRRLALARACGVGREPLRVLDAMAGFGLDGITLACLGCDVVMVERDGLLTELLVDAIARVRVQIGIAGSIEARRGDARDVLGEARPFDCIYFDPMFPVRDKAALPRRSAQMLGKLVDRAPTDLPGLLARALPLAARRVVVKRRRHDPVVADTDWQIVGRSVRFDVYRGRAPARS
jgi:16S rRNA (guanine1516-N2)-methyltransferase